MKYWRHGFLTIVVIGLGVLFVAEKSTPNSPVHAQASPDNSQPSDTTSAPTVSDTTPPLADSTPILPPTSPLVVTVHQADAGVIVDWSDSQPGTFPLNHYLVQRSDNNTDFITLTTVDNAITYTDASGKSGQWYRVVAADNQNPANQSTPSSASQVPIPAMTDNTNLNSNNPSPDTTSPPASANPSDSTPPPPPPTAPILSNSPTLSADSSAPSSASAPVADNQSPAANPTTTNSAPTQTSTQSNNATVSPASPSTATATAPTPTATSTASPSQPTTPAPSTAVPTTNSPSASANSGQPASNQGTATSSSSNGALTTAPDLSVFTPSGTSGSSIPTATLAPLNVADNIALATSPVGHKTASVATGSGAAPADVDLPAAMIAVDETNLTKTEEKKLLTSLNNTATTTITDKASLEQQAQHNDQRNTVQPPQQRSQLLDQFSDTSIVTLNKIVLDGEPNIVLPVLARYNYEKQSILELSARLDEQSKRSAKDHCQLQTGILNTTILALPVGERSMAIEALAKCEAIGQI